MVGRCPESAGAPPAWAWVEALQALAADVDPGRLAPALAPLIDEIPTTPGESDASFGRFLLTRAVIGYLTAAARTRPLAVFLDDLHRGDSETLALLDGVAAGVSGVPLVVIAAYRPAEVPAGLRDALAGLAAVPPTRIALDGLDPAQAARLIRSIAGVQPDQPTLRALVDRTGGNPFYLTESARLLGSEGRLVATSKVPEGCVTSCAAGSPGSPRSPSRSCDWPPSSAATSTSTCWSWPPRSTRRPCSTRWRPACWPGC